MKLTSVLALLFFVVFIQCACAIKLPGSFDEKIRTETPLAKLNFFDQRIFDPVFYIKLNNLLSQGVNTTKLARQHWLNTGIRKGLRGSPNFSASVYLTKNKDISDIYGADNYPFAIIHYLRRGYLELYRETGGPLSVNIYDPRVFNWKWYVEMNNLAAVISTEEQARFHWKESGLPGGMQASPNFSARAYLLANQDLREAYGSTGYLPALNYWLQIGLDESWRENGGSTCQYWSNWCHGAGTLTEKMIEYSPTLPKYNSTQTSLMNPPVPVYSGYQVEINGRICSDMKTVKPLSPDSTRVAEILEYRWPGKSNLRACNVHVRHFIDIQVRTQGKAVDELKITRWIFKDTVVPAFLARPLPPPSGYAYSGFYWAQAPRIAGSQGIYSVIAQSKELAPTFTSVPVSSDLLLKASSIRMEDNSYQLDSTAASSETEKLIPSSLYELAHVYSLDGEAQYSGNYEDPLGVVGTSAEALDPRKIKFFF